MRQFIAVGTTQLVMDAEGTTRSIFFLAGADHSAAKEQWGPPLHQLDQHAAKRAFASPYAHTPQGTEPVYVYGRAVPYLHRVRCCRQLICNMTINGGEQVQHHT